ncbi:MAG: type IV secretion system DNA-binding domain-containing protein [Candidatus Kerfeldbacteria bacterium]|nr:type IV secretion system DNA-binding domain-containing protein [Candidatus Kerfeldbacteria bacterium]
MDFFTAIDTAITFIFDTPLLAIGLYIGFVLVVALVCVQIIRKVIRHWIVKPESFKRVILQLRVPKEDLREQQNTNDSYRKQTEDMRINVAEAFYVALARVPRDHGWKAFWLGRNDHVSLELVADKDQLISFYAVVPYYLRTYFEQQFQAQYNDAVIEQVNDYNVFEPDGTVLVTRCKLKKAQEYPILTYDKLETDPLSALTNVLSKFEKNEGAAIQVIIRPAKEGWEHVPARIAQVMQQGKKYSQAKREVAGSIIYRYWLAVKYLFFKDRAKWEQGIDIRTEREYRLSPMEEDMVKSFELKAGNPGFQTNIRVVVSGSNKEMAEHKLHNILGAFSQYSGTLYANEFKFSKPSTSEKEIRHFIYRTFEENSAFILNTKEMTTLYHMPLPTTETPNIRWLLSKKAAPPFNMPKEGVILGEVEYRGIKTAVRIKRADRQRHLYVIGQTGSGKSVMLSSLAIQDINNGEGVCVIDPHGDLVEDVLEHIPKHRADDVVIFNPGDIERPVGLNMLEYDTDEQKDFAVQEMVAIFYKLFGQEMIGPMFEHYMRNAMLAMMDDKEAGATLIEIPRMFTDAAFRKEKLKKVKNLIVKNFWQQEYEQSQAGQQAADMLSYVISKIGRFLTNDMMRNIVGQARSGFNVREIMDNRKILLVNLSKGSIGEVNSSLLGLIMVSKIQMAAMARANMPKEQRKDFYTYVDEFQNYTTDSIAVILSEARKYKLDLILAHQYINQLVKNNDTQIRDAVFGNVGTKVAFRIGVEDAEMMAKELAPVFNENDVINVEKFTANIKLLIDNTTCRPFNMKTIMPPPGNPELAKQIKQLSRLKYGRDRAIVEAEVIERGKLDQLGGGSEMTSPDSFF